MRILWWEIRLSRIKLTDELLSELSDLEHLCHRTGVLDIAQIRSYERKVNELSREGYDVSSQRRAVQNLYKRVGGRFRI